MLLSTSVFSQDLQVTVAPQDLSCFNNCDGSVTVFATGGVAPYQYAITNIIPFGNASTFVGLCAGEYEVQVKDAASMLYTIDVTILEPEALNISVVNFGNRTIEATSAGGTPPYMYSLNDGPFQDSNVFDNLPNGDYNVYVRDANGCVVTSPTIAINDPLVMDILVVSQVTCAGSCDGAINVTATGGVEPYEYSIDGGVTYQASNNFFDLCAGEYIVTVLDTQNFLVQNAVTITESIVLNPTILTLPSGIEPSGVIEIIAAGGTAPYAFSIDGGATFAAQNIFSDLPPATYNVEIIDASNCVFNIEVTIDATNVVNTVIVNGNTLTATIADAISYQWFDAETGIRIDGATDRAFTPTESGSYRVEITITVPDVTTKVNQNTKSSKKLATTVVSSPTYQVNVVLSTNDEDLKVLKVYPNPTTDYLVLPETSINKAYHIYSVLGQEINSGKLLEKELNVNRLENGIYFLKVDGASPTRFIKQ